MKDEEREQIHVTTTLLGHMVYRSLGRDYTELSENATGYSDMG